MVACSAAMACTRRQAASLTASWKLPLLVLLLTGLVLAQRAKPLAFPCVDSSTASGARGPSGCAERGGPEGSMLVCAALPGAAATA